MKISDIQNTARSLSKKHGWNNNPQQRFIRLIGEIGELADEVVAYHESGRENADKKKSVAFEIYDVVWNLCDLANQLDIDLEPLFEEKKRVNDLRSWD